MDDPRGRPRLAPAEDDSPWNPPLRRTADRDPPRQHRPPGAGRLIPGESLPPSAGLRGTPTPPDHRDRERRGDRRRRGGRGRHGGRRRRSQVLLPLLLAGGLIAGLALLLQYLPVASSPSAGALTDAASGVGVRLPEGWRKAAVPPVVGFTSAARDDSGGLIMIRKAGETDLEAVADGYAALLLVGDRVRTVTDTSTTRAVLAEYDEVLNPPAYLRVTLLTGGRGGALLVGLLQPDEPARRAALDTLLDSIR